MDALLETIDRPGANWGFAKRAGLYSLAPVFDNGSCLPSRLADEEETLTVMKSKEETEARVFAFPASQRSVPLRLRFQLPFFFTL